MTPRGPRGPLYRRGTETPLLGVYPHLLRHSVATTLVEREMPLEQIQKFLGHAKLETTQLYAESTTKMLTESYRKALSG